MNTETAGRRPASTATPQPAPDDLPDSEELRRTEARALARREVAIAPRGQLSLDHVVQADPERALAVVESRIEALRRIRKAALASTSGNDWTLNKDKEGHATATLRKAGAEKIRKFYGISISPRGDVRVFTEGDKTFAEVHGDAICSLTGEVEEDIVGRRGLGEDFTGREHDRVGFGDLKQATRTSLETKAVRILAGMSAVDPMELAAAWNVELGVVEGRCYRGHGYGRSADRGAGNDQGGGGSGGGGTSAGGVRTVSEKQGKLLWVRAKDRASAIGLQPDELLRELLTRFGVAKTAELPADKVDAALDAIKTFVPAERAPGSDDA